MAFRTEKISEIIRGLAARFLEEENNGSSLITVTEVQLSSDEKRATILFTVFPAKPSHSDLVARSDEAGFRDQLEKTALEFAKRKRSDFKQYFKDHTKLGRIPMFDFEIDSGEKNRQKIDDLLNQG